MTLSRRNLIGVALLATLVAVYFAPASDSDQVEVVTRPDAGNRSTAVSVVSDPRSPKPAAELDVLEIRPRSADEAVGPVFHVKQPTVRRVVAAVLPASAPVEPVAPQAPALPFKVLGRYTEDGREAVFLQYKEQNLVARSGDVLADLYQVGQIDANSMVLLYLPLNQRQTLELGPPSAP